MSAAHAKDEQIVQFYKNATAGAMEGSLHTLTVAGMKFVCATFPDGTVKGVEEQLHNLIVRYEQNKPSFLPGELRDQIEALLVSVQEESKASTTIDKYGVYTITPVALPSSVTTANDAEMARRMQSQFDREATAPTYHAPPTYTTQRMCRYGSSCYRKNPQHLRDFYHPPKNQPVYRRFENSEDEMTDSDSEIIDSRSQSEEIDEDYVPGCSLRNSFGGHDDLVPGAGECSVDASLVPSILSVLPHVTADQACAALRRSHNNVDLACQYLM